MGDLAWDGGRVRRRSGAWCLARYMCRDVLLSVGWGYGDVDWAYGLAASASAIAYWDLISISSSVRVMR